MQTDWNYPDTAPAMPGEYYAGLDPEDTHPDIRRYWNGSYWSNPYSIRCNDQLKNKIKMEASPFMVFWKDN